MSKTTCIYLLSCLILFGCYDTSLDATDTFVENHLNYLDQSFDDLGIPNDPFRMIAVTPTSDRFWRVIVEYSGGCESHSFYTWWDDAWSEEGQVRFFLTHNANGDLCEAVVRDTLELDMNQVFSADIPDTTIIRIMNASNQADVTIDPDLADISQGLSCILDVEVKKNECGDGIWEDRWLLLSDSINNQPVWLVPVRNELDVSLDPPVEASYRAGVTLMFGFESSELSRACYQSENGTAVPVLINCFQEE